MSRDLLLEIGTEDLPARYVMPLVAALGAGMAEGLSRRGVTHGAMRTFATPRRLAVLMAEVAETQPEQRVERSGPALSAAYREGQPTPAALGFAKSCGVELAAIGERDGKLHFSRSVPGAPTVELLQAVFDETLRQMDALVPKRMRWGPGGGKTTIGRQPPERRATDGAAGGQGEAQVSARDGGTAFSEGEYTFVRPVQWLLALFGDTLVPLQAFGLQAGRLSYGHRFHAPSAVELAQPADYESRLKAARVWADPPSRQADIRRQIEAEAARLGGHARITEDLLAEVTALVEWPVAISGRFEPRFLELPPEVIVATVETNQRYFTVFEDAAHRRLTSAFITVSNIESRDPAQVIAGNERVVRPRLSDALFFYRQDLQQPLSAFAPALAQLSFQKSLGSVADKAARVARLTETLAQTLGADNTARAEAAEAAALAKCDLVSKMVFEFPELQGIMGGYYAAAGGATEGVASAIRDQYLPAQQGTPIPATPVGQLLAMADRLDSLAGIFAVGQKPTASKDPYALRRAALGVLRICLEGGWPLDLRPALAAALAEQPAGDRSEATLNELLDFCLERLRAYRVGADIDGRPLLSETFEAVRVMGLSVPLEIEQRLRAVHAFLEHPAAPQLAAANKRIRNLLRQADGAVDRQLDRERFEHTSEHALWTTVSALENRQAEATDAAAWLVDLASLRDPVDAFFEAVMVNADDPAVRRNRLALLSRIDALCRSVADLSQLPG
jgi:glycyl-tRNA synthetase beta chain